MQASETGGESHGASYGASSAARSPEAHPHPREEGFKKQTKANAEEQDTLYRRESATHKK
jgi:hypothetical protein